MKVIDFLSQRRIPFAVIEHEEAFDAQHLAHALRVSGHEIAKTVLLRADRGFTHIVAVLPATKRIDLRKLSHALGDCEIALAAEPEIQEHCPDCEPGVVPPFGTQYCMKTVVDESLAADDDIYFEGDTHREAIRMKFADFCRLEQPLTLSFSV